MRPLPSGIDLTDGGVDGAARLHLCPGAAAQLQLGFRSKDALVYNRKFQRAVCEVGLTTVMFATGSSVPQKQQQHFMTPFGGHHRDNPATVAAQTPLRAAIETKDVMMLC